jgi:menaquinone-9 beta-reductase
MTLYDVAVVGGGLAGCSAAIKLARTGLSVVLLEAKTYPHHKVCGEFLSPECRYLFDHLGLTSTLQALMPTMIDTAAISSPDGTMWETKLPGKALGVSRFALDAAMAEYVRCLGVTIAEGTAAQHIQGDFNRGFEIQARRHSQLEQFRARTVIAAYGKRANVDRTFNRQFLKQRQGFIGLKTHVRGLSLPNRIELHTFPGGYCGMSEVEGVVANVCLLAHESVFQPAGSIAGFIEWMKSQNPHLRQRLGMVDYVFDRWLSIAQVSFAPKNTLEGDVLMAGDSAGLITPLAGDGMAMALHSGILAAHHVHDFLSGNISAAEMRKSYADHWRQHFRLRLQVGRLIQQVMLRPRLFSLTLKLIKSVPPAGDFFVRHTRDFGLIRQGEFS